MKDEIKVIIATIAFGMEIDKKDVRFVIHYSMPKSLEGYVQEYGRAGRDQERAECILYYSYSNRKRNDFFIITNQGSSGSRKNENIHGLYSILDYCEEPYLCRRKMQLTFLGEEFDERECKGMCDNCRKGVRVIEADRSPEALALAIVRLIQTCEQYQQKITVKQASEILRGKKPKKNLLGDELMD
jgi:bloom syndrome protein